MSDYNIQPVAGLHNRSTGALVGFFGADGREYLLPVSAAFATTPTAGTAYPGNFTTLTATSTVSGAGFTTYLASPPAIGGTAPAAGGFTSLRSTSLQSVLTDGSGTPGNVTQNVCRGRAAFAASGTTVVVTNSQVAANSTVLVSLGGSDATLTSVRVTAAAGSFTVTGNAAATGTTPFDYVVIQN